MTRALRFAALAMGCLLLAGLVWLFRLPTEWALERERLVPAPQETVFAIVGDLREWPRWSPWREEDFPGLEFVYEGVGEGSTLSWDHATVGRGRITLRTLDPPHRVAFDLEVEDGAFRAEHELLLRSAPAGTRVEWHGRGRVSSLTARLSLDLLQQMLATDMERGLERLEAAATEDASAPATPPSSDPEPLP